jgi:peptidoglycan L-alanyl-D-glutamate endopeptidase CwlK
MLINRERKPVLSVKRECSFADKEFKANKNQIKHDSFDFNRLGFEGRSQSILSSPLKSRLGLIVASFLVGAGLYQGVAKIEKKDQPLFQNDVVASVESSQENSKINSINVESLNLQPVSPQVDNSIQNDEAIDSKETYEEDLESEKPDFNLQELEAMLPDSSRNFMGDNSETQMPESNKQQSVQVAPSATTKATANSAESQIPDAITQKLKGLTPTTAKKAVALYLACKEKGINITITSGLRTFEEQERLYAQGRTAPGNIVTYLRGGKSYHNTGKAFDIAIVGKNGKIDWESPDFNKAGRIGESLGLTWGGSWKKFVDKPHFQT